MKKYFLLLLGVCSLCSLQCRKDKTPPAVLPPATQEGKNTVGFTINAEVWVPYYECSFSGDPCGEISATYGPPSADINSFDFQISRERNSKSSTLTMTSSGIGTITSTGDKIDSILLVFRGENSNGNIDRYTGPRPGSTFIVTRIDKLNQVISGSFELILRESNGSGKEITLKDGRFDFKLNACRCSN